MAPRPTAVRKESRTPNQRKMATMVLPSWTETRTQPIALADALELLEIDIYGLDEMDKRILRIMAENYGGGPVGLNTIAVAVGEEQHTVEEVHEPYLIQEGFMERTPRGRIATPRAYAHFGTEPPPKEGDLFAGV